MTITETIFTGVAVAATIGMWRMVWHYFSDHRMLVRRVKLLESEMEARGAMIYEAIDRLARIEEAIKK